MRLSTFCCALKSLYAKKIAAESDQSGVSPIRAHLIHAGRFVPTDSCPTDSCLD